MVQTCNELFAMGKLIILFILCEFIYVANDVYKNCDYV
jgi:hypothetical protein